MSETWVKRETLWTVAVLVFRFAQTGSNYEQGARSLWRTGPNLGSLTVIVGGSWKGRRAQVGIAYVFAVRRMAGGSVASGMRTQVLSK